LQTVALPLGYAARVECREEIKMERETGFEPATSTLARLHSTTELFPLSATLIFYYPAVLVKGKNGRERRYLP
jgi:hypothetical protein